MTDLNPLNEPNSTPEDVATLYSWANLHGAKYRDFSAARAQTRENTRLRAEQALEEDQRRAQDAHEESQPVGPALVLPPNDEIPAAQPIAEHWDEPANEPIFESTGPAVLEGVPMISPIPDSFGHETGAGAAEAHSAAAPDWTTEAAAEQAAKEAAEKARVAAQHAHEELERAQEEARRAAEYAAHLAAEKAAHQAALQASEESARAESQKEAERQAQEAAEREAHAAAERARETEAQQVAQRAAELASAQAAEEAQKHAAEQEAQHPIWQQPHPGAFPAGTFATTATGQVSSQRGREYAGYGQFPGIAPSPKESQFATPREETSMPAHTPWAEPDAQEPASRPAWLSNGDRPEASAKVDYQQPAATAPASASSAAPAPSLPGTPDDTLQGSRDRLTSRWYALRGIFEGTPAPVEPIPPPIVARPPATAVFSLAGGVGKTSLVATLGRALSARGERVLLVDTAAFGLLPFFFGAMDQRPGTLRTFNPPGLSNDAPIQMVTIDPEGVDSETAGQESLSGEIGKFSRGMSRVLVDLATASGSTTRRILRMSPLVIVPLIPDMNSVVSVSSIDAFFEHNSNPTGKASMPFYVLNQFDASLPLHLDVREVLREQLADRLLPFALRRTPALSEALAEGMTVIDYAPGSPLAEDFSTLAGWVKSLSAPATTSYRGVRWSER